MSKESLHDKGRLVSSEKRSRMTRGLPIEAKALRKLKPVSLGDEEFKEIRRGGCLDQTVNGVTFGLFGVETVLTHLSVMSFPGMDIKDDNPYIRRLPSGKYVPRETKTAKVNRRIVRNK